MDKTGLTEQIDEKLADEWAAEEDRDPERAGESRSQMLPLVREVGKTGDIDFILDTERVFLENELGRYVNSKSMGSSLENAITDVDKVARMLAFARNPVAYQIVNELHEREKNRIGRLPRDEGRQALHSHAVRLLNLDKSRLDDSQKALLRARWKNMRAAEKIYIGLQETALGIEPKKDQGLER